jgi:hypothetical protein
MLDFGALIIPADIVRWIEDGEYRSGWLGGVSLQSEQVFVAVSVQLGADIKLSEYLDQLYPHRAWDIGEQFQKELLGWVKAKPGFLEGYRPYRWFDTAILASEFGLDSATFVSTINHICVVEARDGGLKARGFKIRSQSAQSKLLPMDAIIIPQRPDAYARLPKQLTEAVGNKCVAIIGVGSGGGEIALNLACAGVGRLVLFDFDRLHAENYIRHVLAKRDLGRTKTAGIMDQLRERGLPTQVQAYETDVQVWANDFRDRLLECQPDVLICATDSRDSRRFLNVCAVGFNIPLVIAGILDAGRIGEVILVQPGESACYECVRLELGAALKVPGSTEGAVTPYFAGEEADLQSAVQRFDIGFVASLTTRVALQVLDSGSYERLPANYLVWGRERGAEYANPFRFDHPMSLNYVPVSMRADCPICGRREADLEGIDINGRFAEIIAELDKLSA